MSLAEKFNLLNEFKILRILCGLFFIPHIFGKFFVPAALQSFEEAGFRPAAAWMYLAAVVECFLVIGLMFGIYTSYVAGVAAIHLTIAAIVRYKVSGGQWLWHIGGMEYPLFWAICCVVVAMHG